MDYGSLYEALTNDQKSCFKRLVNGENIFITGNAGTGKSFLVKAFDKFCALNKICLIKTAPTGIAASEIGGVTLHHQFKLKVGLDLNASSDYPKFLDKVDILLIDEISMVRIDIFDKVMCFIALANKTRENKSKKPIQLIFCGDFFQLPPVITKEEKPFLSDYYKDTLGNGYCFQSKLWDKFNIQLVNLTEVIRQEDVDFCDALNKCKYGDASCLPYIKGHSSKRPNDTIWVCGKNATAFNKNKIELDKIHGKFYCSEAEYYGNATKEDNLCDDKFFFKIGAQVVMLTNDVEHNRYHNGTIGTIVDVGYDYYDEKYIEVEFKNGATSKVKKMAYDKKEYKWVKNEYGQKQLNLETLGEARQFPMRIGYAVTIHKSQGQTYDAMNLIPEIFADGQLYVALSRCKSIDKIFIDGYLSNRMVMTSKDVINFYNTYLNEKEYNYYD